MLNEQTGKVTCDICGKYLGNYLTGDYFKLIRLKYCPGCKELIKRQQLNAAQKARRRRLKQERKTQATAIDELAKINVLLREQTKLLQEQVERLKQEGRR